MYEHLTSLHYTTTFLHHVQTPSLHYTILLQLPPFYSRFDLVLVLLDKPEKSWDTRVSTFLLQQALVPSADQPGQPKKPTSVRLSHPWDAAKLKEYISYVRATFQPAMGPLAAFIVQRYYQLQRQTDSDANRPATGRFSCYIGHSQYYVKEWLCLVGWLIVFC